MHIFSIFARGRVNIFAVPSYTPINETTEKRPGYRGNMLFVSVDFSFREDRNSCEHVFGFL